MYGGAGLPRRQLPGRHALPEQAHLRVLLDCVLRLLPTDRQGQHQRQRAAMRLTLPDGGSGRIDPAVLTIAKQAVDKRRDLSATGAPSTWTRRDGTMSCSIAKCRMIDPPVSRRNAV
jgi:hypothetical protein